MSTDKEERVLALLADANPVPDLELMDIKLESPAALVSATEPRRDRMTETTLTKKVGHKPPKPRRLLAPGIAVAAVVTAAVLGFGIFLTTGGDGTDPAAQPTADPVATVEALFDARNQGDIDGYLALQSQVAIVQLGHAIRERPADLVQPSYEEAEQIVRADFMFFYLTGTEWILSDCQASPGGSRPGDVVTCQLIANTGFLKAMGEDDSASAVRFVVEDGVITTGSSDPIASVQAGLAQAAFYGWVEERIREGSIEAGTVPCSTTSIYNPPYQGGQPPSAECGQWIADHLEDWQADLETGGSA